MCERAGPFPKLIGGLKAHLLAQQVTKAQRARPRNPLYGELRAMVFTWVSATELLPQRLRDGGLSEPIRAREVKGVLGVLLWLTFSLCAPLKRATRRAKAQGEALFSKTYCELSAWCGVVDLTFNRNRREGSAHAERASEWAWSALCCSPRATSSCPGI